MQKNDIVVIEFDLIAYPERRVCEDFNMVLVVENEERFNFIKEWN